MYLTIIKEKEPPTSLSDRLKYACMVAKSRKKFGDLNNEQNVHRMICHMFGDEKGVKRENEHLLYRKVDSVVPIFYIQSDNHLNEENVANLGYRIVEVFNLETKIHTSVKKGNHIRINAQYAPTKTVNGKKFSIRDKDARMEWVMNKLKNAGLINIKAEEINENHIVFSHTRNSIDRNQSSFINGFTYSIDAQVEDPDLFRTAVKTGIGRGRAYGCGLTIFWTINNTLG